MCRVQTIGNPQHIDFHKPPFQSTVSGGLQYAGLVFYITTYKGNIKIKMIKSLLIIVESKLDQKR